MSDDETPPLGEGWRTATPEEEASIQALLARQSDPRAAEALTQLQAAHAALPDNHPAKFTDDDARALGALVCQAEGNTDLVAHFGGVPDVVRLFALATKIRLLIGASEARPTGGKPNLRIVP